MTCCEHPTFGLGLIAAFVTALLCVSHPGTWLHVYTIRIVQRGGGYRPFWSEWKPMNEVSLALLGKRWLMQAFRPLRVCSGGTGTWYSLATRICFRVDRCASAVFQIIVVGTAGTK